ncbi:4Fe-4S dicluster domain-containing protein [Saccharolobus islandicus]|uniref:Iron-sulfur protein, putative n=2 Tax=Saccharolobus islandicus TaxID=43080 RepID=C3MU45_SACI4|nr:4Fe-4S dicluster domain-containing protein [Sulfolobus islandicus]ACP37079.1 iron-sulfur protein, putative [Sulfolobus islandicus M.14.25]ACP54218.1 iron-sulfur protein, putative [Sulfolobus islandicus M.16.27]
MILDASIFSRAVIGGYDVKKIKSTDKNELVVGRLTGLYGDVLKYTNSKIIRAPDRFSDGSIFREVEGRNIYKIFEVPAGVTFDKLIDELSKNNYYPAIFPLYLKGTIGGFTVSNGSGFGSYKFGFVKGKKTINELIDYKVVRILAVKYPELIETEGENKFAWSALIYKDTIKYYIPSFYNKIINENFKSVSTNNLIKSINIEISSIFKRNYVPIILMTNYEKNTEFNFDFKMGYIINYNSPRRYKVLIGSLEETRLPELFEYLKKNPDVLPFPYLKEYEEFHKDILRNFKKYEIKVRSKRINKNMIIEASKCINCSLCLDSCLAYNTTNNILYSPLGRFDRLLTGEGNFEFCFGCASCQEACPVGINISNLMEILPQFNENKETVELETTDVTRTIYELEKNLDTKYRNRPVFLLFVGCAAKYDPLGLEGFLSYLLISGDKLSQELSPRVRLVTGVCCGFSDYLAGNLEGVKKSVEKINRLRIEQNAAGIYFLCPEGLYVYNKFSEQKGIFAYEIIKNELKEKEVHLGCWAKKLGYSSRYNECAGLFLTSYKGSPLRATKKGFLTVCPFSTWKFGTISVYSLFLEKKEVKQLEEEKVMINENVIFDLLVRAIADGLIASKDEIAEKVVMWSLGGSQYFLLLTIPIFSKYISSELIRKLSSDYRVKEFLSKLSQDPPLLNQKISTYKDYLSSYNFNNEINALLEEIAKSNKLDYSIKDLVKTNEFLNVLKQALRRSINENLIASAINNIIYL